MAFVNHLSDLLFFEMLILTCFQMSKEHQRRWQSNFLYKLEKCRPGAISCRCASATAVDLNTACFGSLKPLEGRRSPNPVNGNPEFRTPSKWLNHVIIIPHGECSSFSPGPVLVLASTISDAPEPDQASLKRLSTSTPQIMKISCCLSVHIVLSLMPTTISCLDL